MSEQSVWLQAALVWSGLGTPLWRRRNEHRGLLICILCLSGDNTSQAVSKDTKNASGSRRDQHQVLRVTYLNDVKKALKESAYSRFHEALLAYKRTDDYDAMIPVVAALTTERPEDFHLLQSKGCFKAFFNRLRKICRCCDPVWRTTFPCSVVSLQILHCWEHC